MFKIPFNLSRSIIIEKPIEEVFKVVSDFKTWPSWSPWLYMEPNCPVEVKNEAGKPGHFQEWAGDKIGAGSMEIKSLEENKAIHYDLHFLKPWKSYSKVSFIFSPSGAHTELTWDMQGTLPVFLFWMKKMMNAWVGNDYVRGLNMLKDFIEKGEILSSFSVDTGVEQKGFYYVGKERQSTLADIGPAMREDLAALGVMVGEGKLDKPEKVLSIYKKFDMANNICHYVTALGYSAPKEAPDSTVVTGDIPEHKALKIIHKGAYKHLGNGWSTGMNYLRWAKIKQKKSVPSYEVYVSDPKEVEEKDLVTEIFFPSK